MTRLKYLMVFAVGVLILVGCKGSDIPVQPTYLGGYPNPWTLYANGSLDTGWGFFFYPDGSTQSINLTDSTQSHSGKYSMSYVVTGFTTEDLTAPNYGIGFIFGASNGFADYGTHFVDLSSGRFTTVSLWAEDSYAGGPVTVNFSQGGDAGINAALTTSWQNVTFLTAQPMNSVDNFLSSFLANTTPTAEMPLTIYVDQVQYQ